MKRPVGVTVLAIALFLGIPYLLFLTLVLSGAKFSFGLPILAISLFGSIVDWPSHAVAVFLMQFRPALNIAAFVVFYGFLMFMHLVVGAGLLRLQNWARLVLIVLMIVNLVVAAIGYAGQRFLLGQPFLTLLIEMGALIYLFRPEVKQAFGATGL